MKESYSPGDEKKEFEIYRSLCETYDCIYCVDLTDNWTVAYRLNKETEKRYGERLKEKTDYRQILLDYVMKYVERKEQEAMIQNLLPDRLAVYLRTHQELICDYHELYENKRRCCRLKAARLGDSMTEVVLGIAFDIEPEIGYGLPGMEREQTYNFQVGMQDSIALLNTLERDPLTGLYSREFFYLYAREVLEQNPNKNYEIICFDIENFRLYNERYGYTVGNMILTFFAGQIKTQIPDVVLSGRIYGDDFAVLREKTPFDHLQETLEKIRNGAPVPKLVIKAGIADAVRGTSIQILCDHATSAISRIKQMYGVYIAAYDDKLRREKLREQCILDSMEKSLEQHRFEVYYQPKHSGKTGKPEGAEALVRWNHPEYGLMEPGAFIPLFEKIGFIRGLDRYIWAQVCKDIVRWRAQGLPLVPISVNVSRRDFESDDLGEWILQLISGMGIQPELLHVEITESVFTEDPERITNCIRILHQAGLVIELDDFGAGYSSLITLNSMDLGILKIDKSIIQQDRPDTDRNILEFCVQLAKMMKLETVAEGVETEEQCKRIQELGCDYIQGYYYSRPLPAAQFEQYLRRYEKEI